jgi:hypothetical protein
MSELLFVTVGTTAIGNPGIGDGNQAGLATDYLKKPSGEKDGFANRHGLKSKLVAAHAGVWEECGENGLGPDEFDRTSAELTSTIPLLRQQPAISHVIFLSSDTKEGKLATAVNMEVLKGIWTRGDVSETLIPGLETGFMQVTPALEAILKDRQADSAARVYFNVTGGFKGIIPSITYLVAKHSNWSIYYQYQGLNTAAQVFFPNRRGASPVMHERLLWKI